MLISFQTPCLSHQQYSIIQNNAISSAFYELFLIFSCYLFRLLGTPKWPNLCTFRNISQNLITRILSNCKKVFSEKIVMLSSSHLNAEYLRCLQILTLAFNQSFSGNFSKHDADIYIYIYTISNHHKINPKRNL